MEAKANEVLVQLLQRAVDGVDQAVAFSQAQIPDVVEQLLQWHFVYSLAQMAGSVALAGLCLWFTMFLYNDFRSDQGATSNGFWKYEHGTLTRDRDGDLSPACMMYLGPLIFTAMVSYSMFNLDWLKIWIAPKLYLLEYAADLVK